TDNPDPTDNPEPTDNPDPTDNPGNGTSANGEDPTGTPHDSTAGTSGAEDTRPPDTGHFDTDRCEELRRGAATRPVQLGPMAVTEEADLLVVVDRHQTELLVFDLLEERLVDVNAANRVRRTALGIPFTNARLTNVLLDRIESTRVTADGGSVRTMTRLAWVSSSIGATWIAELDRAVQIVSPEGEVTESVDRLFRHRNAALRLPVVRGLNCRMPEDLERRIARTGQDRCDNPIVPAPLPLDEDLVAAGLPWTLQDGRAFFPIPEWGRTEVTPDNAFEVRSLPDAWSTPGDVWDLVWEGTLPTLASRAIRVAGSDASTVRFPGAGTCDTGQDLCDGTIDLTACTPAANLCAAGADPCETRFQLCTVCPEFCSAQRDLCEAGVEPGDRLLLQPLRTTASDEEWPRDCDPWLDTAQLGATPPRLEFVITAVTPDSVEVEPLDADNVIGAFPPEACRRRALQASIRAGESWMFRGTRTWGHTSRHVAEDGVCVPRPDAPDFTSRPGFDTPWTSFHGIRMHIRSGSETPPRDFALSFRVDTNFNATALPGNASVVAGTVVRPPNRRPVVVLADDGRNLIRFFDHRTLLSLQPSPLP
ncbi:MAG: hypothetical protein EA398_03815, partial [Deltaproteobacteria bacterium]